jgi:hypothetical protein
MTRRWWVFVAAFVVSVALFVAGITLEYSALILADMLITVVLFFSR